jgi:FkbM family methyltransferase
MINKIYLDVGLWNGDSILEFIKRRDQNREYKIIGFEPHPNLINQLIKLSIEKDFEFINKGVWIYNGFIDFYPGVNGLTQSSTTFKDKKKFINPNESIKIECIDFSKFLYSRFNDKKTYIVLKMNCEACEYNVLEKMIKDKTIDYINELYVAWHSHKVKDSITQERHDKLIKQLKTYDNLILKIWKYEEGQKESPFIE